MKSLGIVIPVLLFIGFLSINFSRPDQVDEFNTSILQDTCIGQKISGKMQGLWKCWHNNIYSEMTYLDDNLHGIRWLYHHPDKKGLYLSASFINGKKEGPSVSYYKNGAPETITTYKNDYRIFRVELDSVGNIISKGGYVLDSIEVESTTFDPQTFEVANVKKVKRLEAVNNGVWSFYEKGKLKKEYHYDQGLLVDSVIVN